MDDFTREQLEQAEKDLIVASNVFREAKDRVKRGEESEEEIWPLIEARKKAYEHWRSIAEPLVAKGVPYSAEVMRVLREHRG
ncbi:hypothetical protein GCM10010970_07570 [Silvimonas iriomotensis]|uniref:Uncharacterized protein n=2 Tax=Silvimonas iriomotensis TaxID=449662 RepID=A0ABQ2P5L1_9NEIS|nr:hypothetical protein GCM10010970_07570 [Silvimonas iriomotensis]